MKLRGFTLPEILVYIVLLGIFIALASRGLWATREITLKNERRSAHFTACFSAYSAFENDITLIDSIKVQGHSIAIFRNSNFVVWQYTPTDSTLIRFQQENTDTFPGLASMVVYKSHSTASNLDSIKLVFKREHTETPFTLIPLLTGVGLFEQRKKNVSHGI